MYKNMVGLEAEFLLRGGETNELVFPGNYGFDTDDYPILGEFRGQSGNNVAETVGNFITGYYKVVARANEKKLKIDLTGYAEITPELYASVMKKMGTKSIAKGNNIHGRDILTMSDHILDTHGNITKVKISCGLHIHFSSITVYRQTGYNVEKTITALANRITKPVINYFVEQLDTLVYPEYKLDIDLKYRQPGYYELKSYGFEYRSLPFTEAVYSNILQITSKAFELLENL